MGTNVYLRRKEPRMVPPYDELIEALRRDWDIEASWDGLRRFWYVGLTDEGVRKRDEREAATEALERRIDELCRENERLRQQVSSIIGRSFQTADKMDCLERENAELRELARAAWKCINSGLSCSDCRLVAGGCTLESAMRELGVEVDG